jgi:hypothetical protein
MVYPLLTVYRIRDSASLEFQAPTAPWESLVFPLSSFRPKTTTALYFKTEKVIMLTKRISLGKSKKKRKKFSSELGGTIKLTSILRARCYPVLLKKMLSWSQRDRGKQA